VEYGYGTEGGTHSDPRPSHPTPKILRMTSSERAHHAPRYSLPSSFSLSYYSSVCAPSSSVPIFSMQAPSVVAYRLIVDTCSDMLHATLAQIKHNCPHDLHYPKQSQDLPDTMAASEGDLGWSLVILLSTGSIRIVKAIQIFRSDIFVFRYTPSLSAKS
jgi:hypothetical protein